MSEVTKKWKQEGYEAGLAEGTRQGIEQGKKQMVLSMINKGLLSVSQGADELGINEIELLKELSKC